MKPTTDNQQGKASLSEEKEDRALAMLEEMWDRQIMKADDDAFDRKNFSLSDQNGRHENKQKENNTARKKKGHRI